MHRWIWTVALIACGPGPVLDDAGPDAGLDASPDTEDAGRPDAGGPDAGFDAGLDAGLDAGALDAGPFLDTPQGDLPPTLSALGLYPDLPSATPDLGRVHPRAVLYTPQYPLWSNGADKARYLVLPLGEMVDMSGPEPVFPEGTLLFKTFSYEGVPVETRVMRLLEGDWAFAVYGWDAEDATLLDITRPTPVDGREHIIPSRFDCVLCHGTDPDTVLGFDALQLADQLATLPVSGSPTPRAIAETGETAAVLGYLVGNCTHCHNGLPGANSAFDLRPDAALANLIDQPTNASGVPPGLRIASGDADSSIVYQAILATDSFEMPPAGVQVRDAEFGARLAAWINALE